MSKYDGKNSVSYSVFGNQTMNYFLPKGLIFPIVAAFRALVKVDKSTQLYGWKASPEDAWNEIGWKVN